MAKQVVEACVNAGTCAAGASHYAALISALASIWSQVKHQLIATMNNDLIGGSVALAVASTLVGLAWRLWRWIRGVAHDRMFVSYEIPSGTPQYFAALRWVYDQPAVRRASRRLVVNPVGTPLANETDSHAPSSAPDDPEDPLELGLHTVPMLLRDQSLCARVGSSLLTLIFISTGSIYEAEHRVNEKIPDFFTALYFGLTTLTTVGFGDIYPITSEGRLVVCASIVVGVAVVPPQLLLLV